MMADESRQTVSEWLKEAEISDEIIEIFKENAIDATVLPTLSESDLKDMGINRLGDRRRLKLLIDNSVKDELDEAVTAAAPNAQSTMPSAQSFSATPPSTSTACNYPSATPNHAKAPSTSGTSDVPSTTRPSKWPGIGRNESLTSPDDYNIEEIVLKYKDGPALLEELTGGVVLDKPRQTLVQLCVAYLTERVDSLRPTSDQKEALAIAIVKTFPALADRMPGSMGHEGFYHKGDGFIEYRLKTVRNSLKRSSFVASFGDKATKKPRTKEDSTGLPVTASVDTLEKIEWMRYHPPTPTHSSKIREYMEDTFNYRRYIVESENPSITETISMYPRFRDMPELINGEFERLYKGHGSNLFRKWRHQYKPQIIEVAKKVGVLAETADDAISDLDVLETLVSLLPPTKKKGSKGPAKADYVKFLVQRTVVGTDVERYAQQKEPIYTQPYILVLCSGDTPIEHFIVADTLTIPAGKDSLESFDRLYKSFFVFNVRYPSALETYFNFWDGIVYNTVDKSKVKPIVRAKYSQMMAVPSE